MTVRHIRLAALAVAIAVPGSVLAQELEEIVVTAERREEAIQDVPIAVQSFSAENLTDRGVTSFLQLQDAMPSLVIQDNAGFVTPFIRGTGTNITGQGFYASVATYVDGVYVARLSSTSFDLDNVESVQVLAGPQGALYGRNATGGAIVITTKTPDPGDATSGQFNVTGGDYDLRAVNGRISGSFSDTVAGTLSAGFREQDGFRDNLTPSGLGYNTDDFDDRDTRSVSGALKFTPTDKLSLVLRGNYYRASDHSQGGFEVVGQDIIVPGSEFFYPGGLNMNQLAVVGAYLSALPPGTTVVTPPAFSTEFGKTYDIQKNPYGIVPGMSGKHPGGSGAYASNAAFSLDAEYEFAPFTLKSISSYTESKYRGSITVAPVQPGSFTVNIPGVGVTPVPGDGNLAFSGNYPSKVYSQELQLISSNDSSVEWIAGVYYFKEDGKADLTGEAFGGNSYSARNDIDVTSIAGYAQATVPLTDRWSITGGLRYTDEDFDLDDRYDPTAPFSNPTIGNEGKLSTSDSQLTYLGRVQYAVDNWLVYGSVSTGFKSGGLNSNNPSSPPVDSEEITAYEIGLKSDPLPWLRINAAAFLYDYKSIQLQTIDAVSNATTLVNGSDADVSGLELEFHAAVTNDLRLSLTGLILDTEFKDDVFPGGSSVPLLIGGNRLPGATKAAANLLLDWHIPWIAAGSLDLAANYGWDDGYYFDAENLVGTGGVSADSFSTLGLNLRYTSPDEHWKISVWGNNVFDEDYYRAGVNFAGGARLVTAGYPAHYGATLTYTF